MRILFIEDNERLAILTQKALAEDGYVLDIASTGQQGIDMADINEYDVILLDLTLPDIDGLEACKAIRQSHATPIIILTARDATDDRVIGLDSGADDYLGKPFTFNELAARIRAVLRRRPTVDNVVVPVGKLRLDPAMRKIYYLDQPLSLTPKEYTLLQYLMHKPNQVISKTELLEHVWDINYEGFSNVVETYIRYIRHKLLTAGGDPEQIQTVKGHGYLLQS